MLTDDARKPERKPNARFNPTLREHLQQPTLERRLHDSLPQQEGYSREKDSLQSSHTMLSRVYRRGKVHVFLHIFQSFKFNKSIFRFCLYTIWHAVCWFSLLLRGFCYLKQNIYFNCEQQYWNTSKWIYYYFILHSSVKTHNKLLLRL